MAASRLSLMTRQPDLTEAPSIWIYRFYDQAATTFTAQPHENLVERLWSGLHQQITCDGFDIESSGPRPL